MSGNRRSSSYRSRGQVKEREPALFICPKPCERDCRGKTPHKFMSYGSLSINPHMCENPRFDNCLTCVPVKPEPSEKEEVSNQPEKRKCKLPNTTNCLHKTSKGNCDVPYIDCQWRDKEPVKQEEKGVEEIHSLLWDFHCEINKNMGDIKAITKIRIDWTNILKCQLRHFYYKEFEKDIFKYFMSERCIWRDSAEISKELRLAHEKVQGYFIQKLTQLKEKS